jgi:hypothetical protein
MHDLALYDVILGVCAGLWNFSYLLYRSVFLQLFLSAGLWPDMFSVLAHLSEFKDGEKHPS